MKQRSTNSRNHPGSRNGGGSASGAQAVTRALLLLDALGGARDEWALGDLVDELGLRKTTAFRLLGALEGTGFVVRDADRQTYRLGPALIRLGARARRSVGLHDAAHPVLRALAAETGESATLEVLVNEETLILDEVQGGHLVGSTPEVGTRWPAHATSTGKVLLAAQDAEQGPERAARGRLVRMAPATITSWARLARELEEVRRRGYAVGMEEIEAGFVAIAAPVRNDEGRVIAAISVGGPKGRLHGARVAQVAALVRDGAERISARLGAPNGDTNSSGGPDAEHAPAAPRVTRRAETRRRIGRPPPVRAK